MAAAGAQGTNQDVVQEFTSSLKHSPSPSVEDGHIMSERVQNLANGVYMEFENMIRKYDEDVVKNLMPLIVGVLENLEKAISDKTNQDVEMELLKEDNEQLLTQFDREKQSRKTTEERLLQTEDAFENERRTFNEEKESLQSICKMLEVKARNAQDHASRLEEKDLESRKEHQKLQERYTELLRTHMDHVERAKLLLLAEKSAPETPNPLQINARAFKPTFIHRQHQQSPAAQSKEPAVKEVASPEPAPHVTQPEPVSSTTRTLLEETAQDQAPQVSELIPDSDLQEETQDLDDIDVVQQDAQGITLPIAGASTLQEPLNESTLYDEVTFEDADALVDIDDGADIIGGYGNVEDIDDLDEFAAGEGFFGMSNEIENLIKENSELIETKNALNIVKDDLIAKVDELTCEKDMLKDEVDSLRTLKSKLKERVMEIEEENRSLKEEIEKVKNRASGGEDDDSIPMAQRKRFTRVEMARVLMERNQYKERLMELQEAVRWTEMIRASREHPELHEKKKGSMWNFMKQEVKQMFYP